MPKRRNWLSVISATRSGSPNPIAVAGPNPRVPGPENLGAKSKARFRRLSRTGQNLLLFSHTKEVIKNAPKTHHSPKHSWKKLYAVRDEKGNLHASPRSGYQAESEGRKIGPLPFPAVSKAPVRRRLPFMSNGDGALRRMGSADPECIAHFPSPGALPRGGATCP